MCPECKIKPLDSLPPKYLFRVTQDLQELQVDREIQGVWASLDLLEHRVTKETQVSKDRRGPRDQ